MTERYRELIGSSDLLGVEVEDEQELMEEQLFPTLQRNLAMRGYTAFNALGELETIEQQLGHSTTPDDYELPVFSADETGSVESCPMIFVRRTSLTDAAYQDARAEGDKQEAAELAQKSMYNHFEGIAEGEYAAAIDPVLRYAEVREDAVREPVETFMDQLTVLSDLNYSVGFPDGSSVDPGTAKYV